MASINYAAREISVKIVYYGPGLSGKTTNLQIIHRKIPQEHKSDMVSLATETDRTLFFDFLPLDLGTIKGFATKFQLYTVPGQVYYNATRKLVLRGVDGVVFVADSAPDKIPENLESFQNLEDNLAEYHYKREEIPIIIQYNKRDLPNALPIDELQRQVNKYNLPYTESVANKGIGVFDALKLMGKIVIDNLNKKYSRLSRGASGGAAATAAPRAPQQQARPAAYYPPPPPSAQPTPTVAAPRQQTYPMPPQQAMQYAGGVQPIPMPPAASHGAPPRSIPMPPHAAPPQHHEETPQEEQFVPPPQYSQAPPAQPKPAAPQASGQPSYGFVNFEPLPIQLSQPKIQSAAAQQPMPENSIPSFTQGAAPSGEKPFPSAQPQGSGHAVVYPQKQRPTRTQIDERDYSVYRIDPSQQQSFPKSPAANDAVPMDDTDIRMQKKLNTPPNKQQKGFLSKFFNRDE